MNTSLWSLHGNLRNGNTLTGRGGAWLRSSRWTITPSLPLWWKKGLFLTRKREYFSLSLPLSFIFSGATTYTTSSSTIIVAVVEEKKAGFIVSKFLSTKYIYIYIFLFVSNYNGYSTPLVLQLFRVRLYYHNHATIFHSLLFSPFFVSISLPLPNFDPRKRKKKKKISSSAN